jgi:hypothetical protein
MRLFAWLTVAVFVPTMGCSSSAAIGPGPAPPDADASMPSTSPACAASPPAVGSACTMSGLQCEYGTDPLPSCNSVFSCVSGVWSENLPLTNPAGICPTPSSKGPDCPSTRAAVPADEACSDVGLECDYPDGRCVCAGVSGNAPAQPDGGRALYWACDTINLQPGCPYPRPDLGTACTQPSLDCDYGTCGPLDGVDETCQDGTWRQSRVGCPVG